MNEIESQLAAAHAKPTVPPSVGELLALGDALRNGTLSVSQQEIVQALRLGIAAWAQTPTDHQSQ